jgi:hypothetical protein
VQQKDTQLKRLIKTQTNILPYKIYQITDYYIAEKNDVEVFRTKFQHLCLQYIKSLIAQETRLKNEMIVKNIQELKAQGII